MYLSTLSIFELQVGIARAQVRDTRKAKLLQTWLDETVSRIFEGRILSVDKGIARAAGPLASIRTSDPVDVLIAATALTARMTLVTRDTSDFDGMGVAVLNPWIAADA